MSLSKLFKFQSEGDLIIVDLQSEVSSLVDSELLEEMRPMLESAEKTNLKHMVIDFEQVSYFGSIMLEALRALWNHVSAAGGKMVLCNVSDTGREILQLARFDTIWTIYETRAEAIKAVYED